MQSSKGLLGQSRVHTMKDCASDQSISEIQRPKPLAAQSRLPSMGKLSQYQKVIIRLSVLFSLALWPRDIIQVLNLSQKPPLGRFIKELELLILKKRKTRTDLIVEYCSRLRR